MRKLNAEMYKTMYLIRRSEEIIQTYYPEDGMKTPMHMSMGEEAIAVGVCAALEEKDQIYCSYRSHALYLAKTDHVENFFAEMYGKSTSLQKGKSGSMHLCDPQSGFMGASAIVASHIPVAVGSAFANKVRGNGKIVTAFFGDGAVDEGVFWESLNVACLMKIPLLLVCEDNGLAVHTPPSARRGYGSLLGVIAQFDCNVFEADTTDVLQIYRLSLKAMRASHSEQKPSFLHLKYYRYLEHVGINQDFDAGYRSKTEFEQWFERDPVRLQRQRLLTMGYDAKEIEEIERLIEVRIIKSVTLAKEAPFAEPSELYSDVFCQNMAPVEKESPHKQASMGRRGPLL